MNKQYLIEEIGKLIEVHMETVLNEEMSVMAENLREHEERQSELEDTVEEMEAAMLEIYGISGGF